VVCATYPVVCATYPVVCALGTHPTIIPNTTLQCFDVNGELVAIPTAVHVPSH
jgi:hypothetical protein